LAKTPAQILQSHVRRVEQSRRAWEDARSSGNWDVVALNVAETFRGCLFQGLLRWRHGFGSPVPPLQEAVGWMQKGIDQLKASGERSLIEIPAELAGIVSFLVEMPPPSAVATTPQADRLLDAVLAKALRGDWDSEFWESGLQDLRKVKGSGLSVETYVTYAQLLHAATPRQAELINRAEDLFRQRARNGFFAGGYETDGGGPYNALAVDFRLAAIMKKLACSQESIHRWRW
jgi:hypothetical protein